ncbi:hypothetical protein ACFL10_02135 [Patescibacteria group bacterium]
MVLLIYSWETEEEARNCLEILLKMSKADNNGQDALLKEYTKARDDLCSSEVDEDEFERQLAALRAEFGPRLLEFEILIDELPDEYGPGRYLSPYSRFPDYPIHVQRWLTELLIKDVLDQKLFDDLRRLSPNYIVEITELNLIGIRERNIIKEYIQRN